MNNLQTNLKSFLNKNLHGQKIAGVLGATMNLESQAQKVICILSSDNPDLQDLTLVKEFVICVENWKSMGRASYARDNDAAIIFSSLKNAYLSNNYPTALKKLMILRGFKEKTASAILRFLKPVEFGVVDWRNSAVVFLMKKYKNDIDQVIIHGQKIANPKDLFDGVDIKLANQLQKYYQSLTGDKIKRVADIDMALFAISLEIWPMKFT